MVGEQRAVATDVSRGGNGFKASVPPNRSFWRARRSPVTTFSLPGTCENGVEPNRFRLRYAENKKGLIMRKIFVAPAMALLAASGCKTATSAANGVRSAGDSVANAASSVPGLVNVNLSNVLNHLAVDLHVDRANIPVNAQIPISVAANVCGVSINVLSIGAGGGSSRGCTAQTTSPQLEQAVQQQLAANGSVGGGAQTNGGTATTPGTTAPTSTVPATTPPPPPTTPHQ